MIIYAAILGSLTAVAMFAQFLAYQQYLNGNTSAVNYQIEKEMCSC